MRSCVVLVVALAAISLTAAAESSTGVSTSFRVSSVRVLYGHPLTITGRIASHLANRRVAILAQSYGRTRLVPAATVVTGRGGFWSYRARPSIQTLYRARIGSSASRAITVGVQPAVSVRELGNGQLSVRVVAGRSFKGRLVKLQRRTPAGAWRTVTQKPLSTRTGVVFAPSIPSSTIRVAMSVNQAGRGYLGGSSHMLRYHAYSLSLVPSGYRVRFGNTLRLSGRLANAGAGQKITIFQQQFKRSSPFPVATVTTGPNGTWSFHIKPVVQVSFFARWGSVQSPRVRVGVTPLISARETATGAIKAHVYAAVGFKGRLVKLQRLMPGGAWQTVIQKPLDFKSDTVFTHPGQAGTVRIAMSVNEAGAGYLGAKTTPFAYHTG